MKLTTFTHKDNLIYKTDFLGYALSCLEEQGSFNDYKEWLQNEPVMSFTSDTFRKEDMNIISDEDGISAPISLDIELNGEHIYHSLGIGNSWFFKEEEDDKLVALYID